MKAYNIFLLSCLMICASCGAASSSQKTMIASTPQQEELSNLTPEEELFQLEASIDKNLGEIGLSPLAALSAQDENTTSLPPVTPDSFNGGAAQQNNEPTIEPESAKKAPKEKDRAKRKQEKTCKKVCKVVESICSATEKICQITERMAPDSSGINRCERAQNACEKARSQGENCGCSMSAAAFRSTFAKKH